MTRPLPAPVTRRELRLAEQAGRRRLPGTVGTDRRRASGRHSAARPTGPSFGHAAAGTALCLSLLAGGLTQVQIDRVVTAQSTAAAAVLAAELAEGRLERTTAAAANRLTAQAGAHATYTHSRALAAARDAVDTATSVAELAAVHLTPDELVPLDAALADLAALVGVTPVGPTSQAFTTLDAPTAPAQDAPTDLVQDAAPALVQDDVALVAAPADEPARPRTRSSGTTVDDRPAILDSTTPLGVAAAEPLSPQPSTPSLEASEQILVTAEHVAEIAATISAAVESSIAQAAEREMLRVAQEEAAAAELARKIAAADAAPNGKIPAAVLCAVSFDAKALLRCDAAAALETLNVAYREHFGADLGLVSTYRDYDSQVVLRETKPELAAVPGASNHGRGVAVDFAGFGGLGDFGRPTYRWMAIHGPDHGWIHPRALGPGGNGPPEPWHWEFGTTTGR